jgi:hypothetical protein
MTVESATYVNQLDNTLPVVGGPIGEGDDHIRLTKTTLVNTFPNVGGVVNWTDVQLNALLPSSGGTLTGSLTFDDISYTVAWDMPSAANPVELSAIEYTDPIFMTTVTGLRVAAAGVSVNFPPIPNKTAGLFIYNQTGDAALNAGIQFVDYNPSTFVETAKATVGFVQDLNNLVLANFTASGNVVFTDGLGNNVTLNAIVARINALSAIHSLPPI